MSNGEFVTWSLYISAQCLIGKPLKVSQGACFQVKNRILFCYFLPLLLSGKSQKGGKSILQ